MSENEVGRVGFAVSEASGAVGGRVATRLASLGHHLHGYRRRGDGRPQRHRRPPDRSRAHNARRLSEQAPEDLSAPARQLSTRAPFRGGDPAPCPSRSVAAER